MASFSFIDPVVYVHSYDLTTDLKSLTLEVSADELDSTTFGGGGYRSRKGGLKTSHFAGDGYWQDPIDAYAFPALGVANRVVTVNHNGTEANVAYMVQMGQFQYGLGGSIGELMPFSLDAMNTDSQGLIRGQLAKSKGNVSATGQLGSILNLGAPTSNQFVYATFHVFSAGTTITILVESDTDAGFPSPTTRATIGPITVAGGTWMTRVAGPFASETHWRFNVSAITGTFSVAGAIAVQ